MKKKAKDIVPEGIYCFQELELLDLKCSTNGKNKKDTYVCPLYNYYFDVTFKEKMNNITGECRLLKKYVKNNVKKCRLKYKLSETELFDPDLENYDIYKEKDYEDGIRQIITGEYKDTLKVKRVKMANNTLLKIHNIYWDKLVRNHKKEGTLIAFGENKKI
jgi:hypothetical protein